MGIYPTVLSGNWWKTLVWQFMVRVGSWSFDVLVERLKLCCISWWESGWMVERHSGLVLLSFTCVGNILVLRVHKCCEGQWMTEDETTLEHPFLHSLITGRRGGGWRHRRSRWSFVQCPASGESHLNHTRLLLILCFKHSASLSPLPHYERIVMEWIWEEFRD